MRKLLFLVLLYTTALHGDQIPKGYFDAIVALGRTETTSITLPSGVVMPQSKWVTEASGFLYGYLVQSDPDPLKRKYVVFLVTNRHVLVDHNQIEVRLNPEKTTDAVRSFVLPLKDQQGAPLWFSHPDPRVDISVYGVNDEYLKKNGLQSVFIASDLNAANQDKLKSMGAAAGDGVYILGFPMGIAGEERNYVITRKGSIARITDYLAGAQATFLIDALIFPGNSGGPVFSALEAIAIQGTQAQNNVLLIGVVRAYLPYDDVAFSQQTKQPRVIFEENSGLADVVPVDRIDETIKEVLRIHPVDPNALQKKQSP
jgi:S1-C subfamily serine protease